MPVEQPVIRTGSERSGAVIAAPSHVSGRLAAVAQAHLDQLTAADAALLAQERGATLMHLGALARFAGPPLDLDELMRHVSRRLNLVPRFRQKLASPPLGLARQRWIDDPSFNLAYHVRH